MPYGGVKPAKSSTDLGWCLHGLVLYPCLWVETSDDWHPFRCGLRGPCSALTTLAPLPYRSLSRKNCSSLVLSTLVPCRPWCLSATTLDCVLFCLRHWCNKLCGPLAFFFRWTSISQLASYCSDFIKALSASADVQSDSITSKSTWSLVFRNSAGSR